ncbi:hypothetical protein [Aureimonas sp. SK2]|uniref:hypothetical protein n=1 Tax=Aureimonas sp. SK2 TaxID=3015992 RepID=UPI00244520A7|nr:hypothetical protein [Aureimonas sp. SK2]
MNEATFRPHVESSAAIRPPSRSRGSVRGAFTDATGREVVYASTLERDFSVIALTHPDVQAVQEQPPTVAYRDVARIRHHTFDFMLRLRCGTSLAIAVKPSWRVASSGLERTLTLIAAQRPTFADRFEIRTERDICRVAARNARLILHSRRLMIDDAIAEVTAIVESLRGACTIEVICAQIPHQPLAFFAAIRLIDNGHLRCATSGLITAATLVERVEHA